MSTSLAQQLQKLKLPQDAVLIHKKRFASILFDPKVAAEKDRETIFEIANEGLDELIQLNPVFMKFRETLFDPGSKTLERYVETQKSNDEITLAIKRFCYHLSPYFQLQAAHKCLEWLIRRFHMQDYNKDEFMTLILPYHETKVAVKCIQTMELKNPNDKWHWLKDVKKSGASISKQAIVNHCIGSASFLEFISSFTYEAIKELGDRAGSLQVMMNFYCQIAIAVMDVPKSNENHLKAIILPVHRGFEKLLPDFAAASYMISTTIFTKKSVAIKLIEKLALSAINCKHQQFNRSTVILLSCMAENQKSFQITPSMLQAILNIDWFPVTLSNVYQSGIEMTQLIIHLLRTCLTTIQQKEELAKECRAFCESIRNEMSFDSILAKKFISCVLESYTEPITEKDLPRRKSVVEIESEDEEMEDVHDKQVTKWYASFLKELQKEYPVAFDELVDEINISTDIGRKRKLLKNVLGFLLQFSCSQEESAMFENLLDYNNHRRLEAVTFVINQFDTFRKTIDGTQLLKSALIERLEDDCPAVVEKVLSLGVKKILDLIPTETLLNKLRKTLEKNLSYPDSEWQNCTVRAINVLVAPSVVEKCNQVTLICLLGPYLRKRSGKKAIVVGDEIVPKATEFVNNFFADKSKESCTEELLNAAVAFESGHESYVESNVLLLIDCVSDSTDPKLSLKVFNYINKVVSSITSPKKQEIALIALTNFIEVSKFTRDIDLLNPNPSESLQLKIFEEIITLVSTMKRKEEVKPENSPAVLLKTFLDKFCKSLAEKLEFFSLFFVADRLDDKISPTLQMIVVKIAEHTLSKNKSGIGKLSEITIIRFILGCSAKYSPIRQAAIENLKHLSADHSGVFQNLITHLIQTTTEIIVDPEQLPLVMFTILNPAAKRKVQEKQALKKVTETFMSFVTNEAYKGTNKNTHQYERAAILELLKHVNDPAIFEQFVPIVNDLLDSFTEFDQQDSIVLKNVVNKINRDVIRQANKNEEVYQLISKLIRHTQPLNLGIKKVSLAALTLKTFDHEIYVAANEKIRNSIFWDVIEVASSSVDPVIHNEINNFLKQVTFTSKQLIDVLCKINDIKELDMSTILTNKNDRASPSSSSSGNSFSYQDSHNWKLSVTILELLQNAMQVQTIYELIPSLFNILKRLVDSEPNPSVDYVKQLVLSALLRCCNDIPPRKLTEVERQIKIDLIIRCIRSSSNAQTHHHALLLLAIAAAASPDQVLHNLVDIFTFVGTSVARYDDAYSFQIMSKIIENVIPRIVQKSGEVTSLLKVFSDIIVDVPSHRRLIVYTKLIETLGPSKYFWTFLSVLLEGYVVRSDTQPKKTSAKSKTRRVDEESEYPEQIEIALHIAKNFSAQVNVETCTILMQFINYLPLERGVKVDERNLQFDAIFDVNGHSDKQLRFFRYALFQLVLGILASTDTEIIVINVDDNTRSELRPFCSNLIGDILRYIPFATKAASGITRVDYWKVILNYCYDVLDSTVSLLTPDLFLKTTQELIQKHKLYSVRVKALEILIRKLQTNFFDDVEETVMLSLLEPLSEIIESVGVEKIPENVSNAEWWALQQLALTCIKILARQLANKHRNEFKRILVTLSNKLKKNEATISDKVLGNTVLCIGELCANLRAQAIALLPDVVPTFLKLIKKCQCATADLTLISLVFSLTRISEALAGFLSPYLTEAIIQLSRVYTEALSLPSDTRVESLITKLKTLWQIWAKEVPSRVMIPAINDSYEEIIKLNSVKAIGPIMDLAVASFGSFSQQEFVTLQGSLTDFFVKALQFRCNNSENTAIDPESLNAVEEKVTKAFSALILKLSESTFRPLYYKIQNWAFAEGASKQRLITFFKLSYVISESLKSLYVLFANDVIQPAADLLKNSNSLFSNQMHFDTESENLLIIEYILRTIRNICLFDSQKFIDEHRFNALMEPVVDQVENSLVIGNVGLKNVLKDTIVELGVVVADDTLWKQLNLHLLEKTRRDDVELKMFALDTTVELARRLGEDYAQLLPETIPFFAEMMESDVEEVVKAVQRALQELEKIVGEDLQKHF